MGWFWSNTSSAGEAAAASQASTASSSSQPDAATASSTQSSSSSPLVSLSSSSSSSTTPTTPTTTTAAHLPPADDGTPENDPELRKFVAMFQSGEIGLEDPRTAQTAAATAGEGHEPSPSSKLAAWKATWSSSSSSPDNKNAENSRDKPPPVLRERSLAEATLPVSMSCRQAFDLAWACQSPAGQWRAVYRHGGVRPCSDLWDDFWFCMRVKGYAEGPLKEEAVRSHYRKKEIDRYYLPGRPSSEDVWRSRTVDEILPPGAVFQQNFQVVVGNGNEAQSKESGPGKDDAGREDAVKILADAERRQKIREGMGYEK